MYRYPEKKSWKGYVFALLAFLVIGAVFFLCEEYLPTHFTYGWIATAILTIILCIGLFAMYGWAGGFFCIGIVLLWVLITSVR